MSLKKVTEPYWTVKTDCIRCGCIQITKMSEKELRERYGYGPNFDMECGKCMDKYATPEEDACYKHEYGNKYHEFIDYEFRCWISLQRPRTLRSLLSRISYRISKLISY